MCRRQEEEDVDGAKGRERMRERGNQSGTWFASIENRFGVVLMEPL